MVKYYNAACILSSRITVTMVDNMFDTQIQTPGAIETCLSTALKDNSDIQYLYCRFVEPWTYVG